MRIDLKIISKKLLNLINLSKIQILDIYKKIRIIIIYKNWNFIFAIFELKASSLKSFNKNQKLVILGFVLGLYKNYFSQNK